MNDSDDKELWDLLGKAAQRKASPMFSQNVLRAVRLEEAARDERRNSSFFAFLKRTWALPAAVMAIALCMAIVLFSPYTGLSLPGLTGSYSALDTAETEELASLEQTALAMSNEDTGPSLLEMASCYEDTLSDDEIQYVLALF